MEIKIRNSKMAKKPLSITVYDELYKMIMDGVFAIDNKLPSEVELAKMFNVSRMTLRQALALLKEDGLLTNIQGKGNYVAKPVSNKKKSGLEKMGNPIYKCHTSKIDNVSISYRLDTSSDYTSKILLRKSAAVVAIKRWYKSEGKEVAFAFTYMSIETVSELGIDLNDDKQLLDMLDSKVYEIASSATIEIKRSNGTKDADTKNIVGGDKGNILFESLYVNEMYPLLVNKFYIPENSSDIIINVTNK
ncbi:GntR family transcriptional regulator [Lysinibacillus sp. NPDC059133]|uniref:GntR family transcriptional regulator n=1 Tax=Lysinibacillus sp. NPDC059133 TaxID=3346737 RepID=UPI0036871867